MTVVVLGLDALDPDLVDPETHPNLSLAAHRAIDTIDSVAGEPSTHELWPTIVTGLEPREHGLVLDDGVAWGNPVLDRASDVADYLLPDALQTRIGAWLLTNTDSDAFRTRATYYEEQGLSTLFDGREALPIGVPNYVVDPDSEDREHQLRRSLGDLFERDPEAVGGHTSADPDTFYEQCLEMLMIRVARTRRGLRGGRYELVFGYTSGLDLVGHVAYDAPDLQERAYAEADEFVGELRGDLDEGDELLLVSDHGLQDGVHTHEAMVAGTDPEMVEAIGSVTDVRAAVETELDENDHSPEPRVARERDGVGGEQVREQLEDLGYM
ncbi:alkaline phosphatase family protein [Salinirubellus salinus]|jgi:predicted AlkP superfamily pyrophosphatase or phosphodiesterase|uniref:Alkaline phosphatase family protein n=1 Tax=Salinirubellus salinus TaxID=1364945 RepID=A0A9E7R635_9EURY|nr:alkaline phosphatase family protein [Salinirubellus salinus]UWM56292.1 alkaline phosphatase family protein [Salinirubellus salinus]